MKFKKAVKKVARKVRGHAIKRYFNKGYQPKVDQIMSDVTRLKALMNVEKKVYTIPATLSSVGQVNGNNAGFLAVDLTPVPSVGVSEGNRTGTSIKLTSSHMQFQFIGQSAAINRTRFRLVFLENKGEPITNPTTWASSILLANPFITGGSLIDYASCWNQNTYGNFRIIKQHYMTINPDSITSEVNIKSLSLGFKYNHGKGMHIRYGSGTNVPSHQQIIMLVFADTGNCSTSIASTGGLTGLAQTAINTGYNFNYYIKHYFIDN